MKISLKLFNSKKANVALSKDFASKVQNEISKFSGGMDKISFNHNGQTFTFAPHYSKAEKLDCVLANHGPYTRLIPANATEEDVLLAMQNLVEKTPMFNCVC